MVTPVRWGICGAGNICNDFVIALLQLQAMEGHKMLELVSVAARDVQRAEQFAEKFHIMNAYGSYEQLAADRGVDIVYVGVHHPGHLRLSKLMLNAGKHVLCEKPLTMNEKQTQELVDLAREKNLFLMEGLWSYFFPIYDRLREEIVNGTIGEPLNVVSHLCKCSSSHSRTFRKDDGRSSLLTIGIYPIALALKVFGINSELEEVKAVGVLNEDGCDLGASISLKFSGGRQASLFYDLRYNSINNAVIFGTKGKIEIPEFFWCPTRILLPAETVEIPLPTDSGEFKFNFPNSAGLLYEAREVCEYIRQGMKESDIVTHDHSVRISSILDEVRRQIGVEFDCD